MPTWNCALKSCVTQIAHESEAVTRTLYNAHITTHMTKKVNRATLKGTAPMEESNNKAGNPLVECEFIKSVFKSFKMPTEANLDKVAHQLVGYPWSNLQKLLNTEDNNQEGPAEENLPKLTRSNAMKNKDVWHKRRELHQMIQDMREPMSRFITRLQHQAKRCGCRMTCRGKECN